MPASKSRGISFSFRGPGYQVPANRKKVFLWLSHSYCQTWAKTLTGTHEVSSLFCCHANRIYVTAQKGVPGQSSAHKQNGVEYRLRRQKTIILNDLDHKSPREDSAIE